MSQMLVTLTIDGEEVTVPKGTLLVDAAKQVGIDIPIFCYHPKLEPAGMCRMCLVEIGRPTRDRATGEPVRDEDGNAVIQFGPNLETACTTRVDEGWEVRVYSEKAIEARNEVVEFLLTSHPLDCPVCDKGGECPLQDQTMEHGPGKSRFLYDDKKHLEKSVPLGELIFLDRERCVQCGRCIRFQETIADDPVINFSQRGRGLEIVTYSDPGFDSYFSGNTTDICPVGALTTTDFRFAARPWELNSAASVCTHCPVGCNTILNTRREAKSGGAEVIKRVMPRQNEFINEIWLCDKGRFGHHYATHPERLRKPLLRKDGELVETGWEEALEKAASTLRDAGDSLVGITSGRASNEDLFNFRELVLALGGKSLLLDPMAGGDWIFRASLGQGSNLGDLGEGDGIFVIGSDLHEEAPIWWLRVKQAAERGARLIVANARSTRLEAFADHVLRYPYGNAVHTALGMLHAANGDQALAAYQTPEVTAAGKEFMAADSAVIFFGAEGLDFQGTEALAQACASLLAVTDRIGRKNNGLIPVWPRSNTQGAWDMGLKPTEEGFDSLIEDASVVYLMAADPFGDDPSLAKALPENATVIVQELFRTKSVEHADVVFPAQSFVERDGSLTSGERIVQRFYKAVAPLRESLPDWQIAARLAEKLGLELASGSAAGVFRKIAESVADYAGLTYLELAQTKNQWPYVGDKDIFFGGTSYKNHQGLGVRIAPKAGREEGITPSWTKPKERVKTEAMLLVPMIRLYDHGTTVIRSEVLEPRLDALELAINPHDGENLGVGDGKKVEIRWNGQVAQLEAVFSEHVPTGTALLGRSLGVPLQGPEPVEISPVK